MDTNSLCRACLSEEVHLMTNEETKTNAILYGLLETFTALTGFETHNNFGGVFNLCKPCEEKLKFCYEFRELCIQSYSRLQQQFLKVEVIQDEEISMEHEFESSNDNEEDVINDDDVIDEDDDEEINNDIVLDKVIETVESNSPTVKSEDEGVTTSKGKCLEIFSEETVKRLIEELNNMFNKFYKCVICKFFALKAADLQLHIDEEHPDIKDHWCNECNKLIDPLKEHKHNEEILICKLCNKSLTSRICLIRHYKLHTGIKKFVCEHCNKSFATKYSMELHRKTHGNPTYNCQFCPNTYTLPTSLRRHLLKHTQVDPPHKCKTCKKKFNNEEDLENHDCVKPVVKSNNVTKVKPIKKKISSDLNLSNKRKPENRNNLCNFCGKQQRTLTALKEHIRLHTGEKPFKCQYCDVRTRKKNTLIEHERTHTGEKPFKCDFCPKTFSHRGNLYLHAKLHKNISERPFPCLLCKKRFCRNRDLEIHMRSHTGEKPYTCTHCPKAFKQASHLTHHLKTHSGLRPHTCIYCGKSFKENFTLKTHERLHTGEKPYKCNICNRAFSKSYTLTVHMKQHQK